MAASLFTWVCILVWAICLSIRSGETATIKEPDQPIVHDMDYKHFCNFCANWSTTEKCVDFTMSYPVVDYSQHANNFDQFRDRYPFFSIQAVARANSPDTFGDHSTSGSFQFETIAFDRTEYLNKAIVDVHSSAFWWDVGAQLGVGLKKDGNKLIIRPYVNGWIYSGGAVWRCLEVGLGVTKVTFIPKSGTDEAVEIFLFDSNARVNVANETFYSHE